MLTKEFIAESKNKLNEEKTRLEKELVGLTKEDFGKDIDHGEEKGSETEQIEDDESVAAEYSTRLIDIDSALEKIEDGVYGECESCHKEISEKVLKIDPESRLCEDCKESLR
jgi:DnaK suppressor protein